MIWVTRRLELSDRTTRRWRTAERQKRPARRGRPGRAATVQERNAVLRFLRERGAGTPLYAVRRAFPDLRRSDLSELHRRYRRVQQRRRARKQSRLKWLAPGTVWAADFKERREPIEGRYGWILSIKDLASRYQLAWQPLEAATAAAVQAVYRRLFDEHGPPLVLKSDNGSQFRDEGTKATLAQYRIAPLYNPVRHPSYNGGVERANGQLAGYQEAVAEAHGRAGLPTRGDAEQARQLANELTRRDGFAGLSAQDLWEARSPIASSNREDFLRTLAEHRVAARQALHFEPAEELTHYQQAAVDRLAVRDTLVAQQLLEILPRRRRRQLNEAQRASPSNDIPDENASPSLASPHSADKVKAASLASSIVDEAQDCDSLQQDAVQQPQEKVTSSTSKTTASGQNYG